jgi:large subunit ribosomal protein L18
MTDNKKIQNRNRRHARIRARVKGTSARPRLSVFKSNTYMYAQLVDDTKGAVIGGVTSQKVAPKKSGMEQAEAVGAEIAKIAKEKKVEEVVFDRGGFIYTGKVKALADAARAGGLKF